MSDPALLQANPPEANPLILFLQNFGFLAVIFAIIYFLLIRPARTKQKRHQEMLRQLRQGDRVVTAGGMYGTVVGVSESVVTLRIAEGVKAEFQKTSIAEKGGKEPE